MCVCVFKSSNLSCYIDGRAAASPLPPPAEAVNNAAGYGFSGMDERGNPSWDLIRNLNILGIEVRTVGTGVYGKLRPGGHMWPGGLIPPACSDLNSEGCQLGWLEKGSDPPSLGMLTWGQISFAALSSISSAVHLQALLNIFSVSSF